MPLPLTVSCFSKIQIGFTFLVPAHPGSPGKRAVKRVCVCVLSGDNPKQFKIGTFLSFSILKPKISEDEDLQLLKISSRSMTE